MIKISSIRLGQIAPAVLGLCVIVELALQLIPLERFCHRAWEAVRISRKSGEGFSRNLHVVFEKSYGDLAGMSNLVHLRNHRREEFTTDAFGCRNPAYETAVPAALLLGDSYAAGVGVSDDQTLSQQLSRQLGTRIYNASLYKLENVPKLAARLKMNGGVVIYQHLARSETIAAAGRAAEDVQRNRFLGIRYISRLKIIAQNICKTLHNDQLLPNIFLSSVKIGTLPNGQSMLFLPGDLESVTVGRQLEEDVNFFINFSAELRKNNLTLAVLLVPNKYTVYAPFVSGLQQGDPDDGLVYMNQLQQRLEKLGIAVLNVGPVLRRQASDDLETNQYVYLLDDTHWNARGIQTVAKCLAQTWAGLLNKSSPTAIPARNSQP